MSCKPVCKTEGGGDAESKGVNSATRSSALFAIFPTVMASADMSAKRGPWPLAQNILKATKLNPATLHPKLLSSCIKAMSNLPFVNLLTRFVDATLLWWQLIYVINFVFRYSGANMLLRKG